MRKESAEFYDSLDHSDDDDEANFDTRMRLQILKKRKELGDHPQKQKLHKGNINICSQIQRVNHLNMIFNMDLFITSL